MQLKRILVVSIIIALALFGCKKSDGAGETNGKVKLNVLFLQDVTAPESKVDNDIFAAFEQANPNIELEFEKLFNEAFHQKVRALAAANKVPDVVYMWPGGRSKELTTNGLMADLYPYLGSDRSKYADSAMVPQGDGKGLYELPYTITATHVLYANTRLMKELGLEMPKSYEELLAMVPVIEEAQLQPIIMPNKSSWVMQSCLFSTIVGRMTGNEWATEVAAGKASFTDQGFVDSLATVRSLYTSDLLTDGSIQLEYGDSPNLFAEGKGVFMIDGDWRVNALTALMSDDLQEDIELTVIPTLTGEISGAATTSVVPGCGLGMKAGLSEERAAAAWKLIAYYSGAEAAEKRLIEQGVVPAYKIDMTKYDLPPLSKKRGEFTMGIDNGSAVLDNVFSGKVIDRINNGLQEIALGAVTPENLAKELDVLIKSE